MGNNLRLALTFAAAVITALAVTDPLGVPVWVQATAGVLSTGFAAIGILPPGTTRNHNYTIDEGANQ